VGSSYRRRLLDTQDGRETLKALSWQDFERLDVHLPWDCLVMRI